MTVPSKSLTIIGLVCFAHAIYSAYEHASLSTRTSTLTLHRNTNQSVAHTAQSSTVAASKVPLDIKIETVFASLLLLVAIVLEAPSLRPIRWSEWAGRIEREGWDPNARPGVDPSTVRRGGAANPYKQLEERRGFLDIRRQRNDFAEWVREGGQQDIKELAK